MIGVKNVDSEKHTQIISRLVINIVTFQDSNAQKC